MWIDTAGPRRCRRGLLSRASTIIPLALLSAGGSLHAQHGVGATGVESATPRQECVTWEALLARQEARGGRRNPSPSVFHTGVLIRATGNVASDANGVDFAATVRQMTILVDAVLCGSPAAASGLREGDEILTVNEKHASALGVLPSLQYPRKVGERFRVRIRRGDDTLRFTVTSVRRPREAGGAGE